MRKVDDKFHVEGDQILKTSTGEVVPESEPTILFRGRDHLALPLLEHYIRLCELDGCNDFQLASMAKMVDKFRKFKDDNPLMMKQPGITRGKVYEPGKEYK